MASATAVNVTAVGVVAVTAGTISVSIMAVTTARANIPSFNREHLIVSTFQPCCIYYDSKVVSSRIAPRLKSVKYMEQVCEIIVIDVARETLLSGFQSSYFLRVY